MRSQAFFSKFDAILDSWGMIFNSNTRAATGIILALKHLQRPFGVQRRFTRRARSASLMGRVGRVGLDGSDGSDGSDGRSSKVSFNFLHTLYVYRLCIYLLTYEIKIVTNILIGFKIWCQVGAGVTPFLKLPYVREFWNIWFQKLTDIRCKSMGFKIWCHVGGEGQNFHIYFRLGTYNVHEGPSANPYDEARSAEFDARVGRVGRMGRWSKVSFNFLHT